MNSKIQAFILETFMSNRKIQTFVLAMAITVGIMVIVIMCLPKTPPPVSPVTIAENEWSDVVVKPPSKFNQTLEIKLIWKLDSYEEFFNNDLDEDDCKNIISLYWDKMKLGSLITLDSDENKEKVGVILGMNDKEYMSFENARQKLQDYAVKSVEHSLTRGNRTRKHTIVFESLNPEVITVDITQNRE